MRIIGVVLALSALSVAQKSNTDADVGKVVQQYVSLYKKETLPQWKQLFHPQMTASHAAENGSIGVRTLEEFYESQRKGFEEDSAMHETLSNVRIARGKRIARVTADYLFTSEGKPSRGKLGLHLVQGKNGWKIVGVVFSYDE